MDMKDVNDFLVFKQKNEASLVTLVVSPDSIYPSAISPSHITWQHAQISNNPPIFIMTK